jgi:hypothetical protein
MNFEYIIENGEVTITGVKDKSLEYYIVPETIEDYPVTNINVNNDQYFLYGDIMYKIYYKIYYKIGDDCIINCEPVKFIIDNKRYRYNFIECDTPFRKLLHKIPITVKTIKYD